MPALAGVVLLSLAACVREVWAADFWWQHATGRWVLEHGWPAVDVFSYTAAGRPWIELRWLFCVAQYLVVEHLGWTALALAKWAAVALAFGLTAAPFVRRRPLATASLLGMALLAASQRFLVRPELVSFVMLGAFAALAYRHRRREGRAIWLLVPLQVVWVNAHTLFVLGPVVAGAMLAAAAIDELRTGGRRWHRLGRPAVLLAAVTLACLVNPWGLAGALFPLRLYEQLRGTAFKEAISEFRGPFTFDQGFAAVRWYVVLLALCGWTVLVARRRLDAFWTLLCAAMLYLSLLAIRNIPLFALAAVPFVLAHAKFWPRPVRALAARPGLHAAASLALAAVTAGYAAGMAAGRLQPDPGGERRWGVGLAEHRYPVAAAEFIERHRMPGEVFGTLLENAYLIEAGRAVYFDPRLEVYDEALFRRFLAMQRDPAAWRREARTYGIRTAVVDVRSAAARLLGGEPGWALVHFDEVAAVFGRRPLPAGVEAIASPEAFARALAAVRRRLPPVAAGRSWLEAPVAAGPYLAVADFLLMNDLPGPAAEWIEDAAQARPPARGLALRRATLAELRGDHEATVRHARAGLERAPGDPRLHLKLGMALYRTGRSGEARVWLERGLEGQPDRALAWDLLGRVEVAEGRWAAAENAFARAVDLEPQTAVYRIDLSRVVARQGRAGDAARVLDEGLVVSPGEASLWRERVDLEIAAGRRERAAALLERALVAAPGDPGLLERARRLMGQTGS